MKFLREADHSQHEIRGRRGGGHILCLIITTDEIVHDIGVPDAFCNLLLVANVPFLPRKTKTIVADSFYNLKRKRRNGERTIDTI